METVKLKELKTENKERKRRLSTRHLQRQAATRQERRTIVFILSESPVLVRVSESTVPLYVRVARPLPTALTIDLK